MLQQQVQPPNGHTDSSSGYGLAYTSYLHLSSWLLRKSVAMMSATGDLFDKTIVVPTPGLGEGHVRICVCLPRTLNAESQPEGPARPLILVTQGGGFVLGQPSDGEHIDRQLCD